MFSAFTVILGIVSLIGFGLPLLKAFGEVKDSKKRLEQYKKLKNQFLENADSNSKTKSE